MNYLIFAGVICVSIILFFYLKMLGTPNKNKEERIKSLEKEIESFGGKMISAVKSKRVECPYNTEFNDDDGSLYIPYKIKYLFKNEIKEGWAILKIKETLALSLGITENKWILRL